MQKQDAEPQNKITVTSMLLVETERDSLEASFIIVSTQRHGILSNEAKLTADWLLEKFSNTNVREDYIFRDMTSRNPLEVN
jgi:hypothetical protein